MSTQPVVYYAFSDADECDGEFDREADALDPIHGILVGLGLCVPFWAAAVYLVVRWI
jgi:hypothetical protein